MAHGRGYLLAPEGLRPLPKKTDRGLNNTRTRTRAREEVVTLTRHAHPMDQPVPAVSRVIRHFLTLASGLAEKLAALRLE